MIFGITLMAAGTVILLIPKKAEKTSGISGGDETTKKEDNTPPPDFSNYQKWVYSIENGKDFCRWYDRDGRNTRTYNSPCSKSQAGMYSNKKESTN